jgi:hypothetical protein
VLLNCGSSRQTRKNRRQACFLTGGWGQKTRREPILTKYGAARRIFLITLSDKNGSKKGESKNLEDQRKMYPVPQQASNKNN